MPRKPQAPRDDAAQYKRFLETAKKVEASHDPKDFERAFKRVTTLPKKKRAD